MPLNYFTEEHQTFREGFRAFLQKEVIPHIEKWEKTGTIERFIWEKFGEMGYFGINYPEAYGGLELDLFYTTIFLEEMQRIHSCLLYTSPSPRDRTRSRMPSSA